MFKPITHIGLYAAVLQLMPHLRLAGTVACDIQRSIKDGSGAVMSKGGNAFADALTDADLLLEDVIGTMVRGLFSDAHFYGEEHAQDRVSRYLPKSDWMHPWLVTLDPINGTRYFKNGLQCFETIVTFSTQDSIRGAIVYYPMSGKCIFSCDGTAYHQPSMFGGEEKYLIRTNKRRTILLAAPLADKRPLLEKLGYTVVCPSIDYKDGMPWNLCPAGILDGRICGMALGESQLIDNVAIAYVAGDAGAIVKIVGLDFKTKMAERIVAGTTPQIFDDIMQALA